MVTMATTSERMRAWSGPAIFSFGFRPFFFGAACWAALAMILWIATLTGRVALPTAFDPISWHAHEFLFGYLSAVVAGFMMTAVPNWTGRMPIVGWPLAGLFCLWFAGRLAVLCSGGMNPLAVALIDLSFLVALALAMGREIVAGRNWRNLVVVALLVALICANAVFHVEAARGAFAAEGIGLRLGVGAALMMIGLIGGRIIPSFTRNWLARRGPGRLPVPPMQVFDRLVLAALLVALISWVVWPAAPVTGGLLLLAGVLHAARLARWAGNRTGAEPLVWVLHAGYAFLPLGALVLGAAILWPGVLAAPPAMHLWLVGAVGLMTLAVMTRATLGHTGQELTAGRGTTALYLLVILAAATRLLAGVWPGAPVQVLELSGASWIAAFAGFAILYGPVLWQRRPPR